MLAKVQSCTVVGIDGILVDVEVDFAKGVPCFCIVGMPDGAVRESRDRVRAALRNSDYRLPARKITVNLAPASLKKEGAGFDLPIAIALLVAAGLLAQDVVADSCFVGELSLDGGLRPVRGCLPILLGAITAGFRRIYIAEENREEALMVADQINIFAAKNLTAVVDDLADASPLQSLAPKAAEKERTPALSLYDFSEVRGQLHARRALEIAASGGHNILMKGPPGSGKTMLAKRVATILPSMTFAELLETAKIHSVAGGGAVRGDRPFRAPHHTISDAGLIGGGTIPRPGEVSLAHNGVLFLDELPEFKKNVLEVLRQPLEDGEVTISRSQIALCFPANFMLVCALNPCACGYYGDPQHECSCSPVQVQRYLARISGPLLDRIDLHIEVPALNYEEMSSRERGETSAVIKSRVEACRSLQQQRFAEYSHIHSNSQMGGREIERYCQISKAASMLLEKSIRKLGLSARAYHRILKIARTIADMDGASDIAVSHIAEAVQFRRAEP